MFTGIIETEGIITDISGNGSNKTFWIKSPVSDELTVDQSVAHNGVCLTVEEIRNGEHRLTAIEETLQKTNLGRLARGSVVNMERCLRFGERLDGHIVQGHVDAVAVCSNVAEKAGSHEYSFLFDQQFAALVIEKGSVTINGISLTIFNVKENSFTVAIIPYTFEHTNMQFLQKGDEANIEFDMIGKYVNRFMQLK